MRLRSDVAQADAACGARPCGKRRGLRGLGLAFACASPPHPHPCHTAPRHPRPCAAPSRSKALPFSEDDRADTPASLYAATKRSLELVAHTYHNIYRMSVTGGAGPARRQDPPCTGSSRAVPSLRSRQPQPLPQPPARGWARAQARAAAGREGLCGVLAASQACASSRCTAPGAAPT
jgi:hypothetical protein